MFKTITPILSIIIAIVVFVSFTKPTYSEIKILQTETEQYKKTIDDAKKLNLKLNELVTQKQSYSSDELERLEALVPTKIDEVHILADLSNVAKSHKMLLGNVALNPADESGKNVKKSTAQDSEDQSSDDNGMISYDDLISSDITFEVMGTYEQFKSFLADVERSLVLLETINISVTASEELFQQYSVTLRAYAMPNNVEQSSMSNSN